MSEIATGGRLGAFQVKDLLGEGGMGKVWRAHDTTLGRNVALKVLPDLFADDPERLARFQREAQLLAALNHPNIAGIHGIEDDASAGIRALVLELVEGPTLADRIAHGAMPIEDALPIARQIAQAIDAAHEQGIIHRDRRLASQRPSSPASVSGGRCVPPRHGYRGSSSRHRTRHSPPPRRPLIWRLSRRHSRRLHLWRATAALRAGGRRARSEGADRHACRTGTVFLTWWRVGRLLRRHRRLVEEDLDRRRAGRDRVSKRIDLLNLETGQQTALIPIGSHPRYTPTGHIVYGTDGTLRAVPFDLDSLAVIGDPVPVLDGVVTKDIDGAANFGLAGDGSLVYATGAGSSLATNTIVWVARDGTEEDLEAGPGAYSSVRVSPDGRQLALAFDGDVHTYDTERGTFNRITTHSGTDQHPLWTVDGAHLVFESDRGGSPELFRTLADGSGTPALVLALKGSPTLVAPETWTPDGATLLFVEARLPMVDISALSMEGDRVVELLIDDEFQEGGPAIAPDGRWLAYHSNRSGQYEVYVERFPELGNRQPISIGGGRVPRWSPDGTELFYQSLDGRQLLAVPITTGPTLTAGASDVLFEGPFLASTGASRPYDPHPDGERFAMIKVPAATAEDGRSQVVLVQNWLEELKVRVPIP